MANVVYLLHILLVKCLTQRSKTYVIYVICHCDVNWTTGCYSIQTETLFVCFQDLFIWRPPSRSPLRLSLSNGHNRQ